MAPGIWEGNVDMSRIYNHDDTPQFVKYGEGGAASELVYSPKGEECKKAVAENIECDTNHPFVCLDGSLVLCHVIFKGETLTSKMITSDAVEKIKNLLISNTENGSQDGRSCLAVYKFFATKVINESKKPCVILTDGHSSRFNYDVMSFCRNTVFISSWVSQILHMSRSCLTKLMQLYMKHTDVAQKISLEMMRT